MSWVEDSLIAGIGQAVQFHRDVTHLQPPFTVELGLVGVEGRLLYGHGYATTVPVLARNEIVHRAALNSTDKGAQMALVSAFAGMLQQAAH
jgi:hypothetical protein